MREAAKTRPAEPADEVLRGETGYWQHWWNMLHDPSTEANGRLTMEVVVPVDGGFAARSWHAEFDRDIRNYAVAGARIGGRVIVPPSTVGSPAEPLILMALDHGFEVRILRSSARLAIYNGTAAVLAESVADDDEEEHRLTRSTSVVEALRQFFELLWSQAVDWDSAIGDRGSILELLALGWTDERIAGELGLSTRTINRRVTEMMREAGAQSRFALGVKVARAGVTGH